MASAPSPPRPPAWARLGLGSGATLGSGRLPRPRHSVDSGASARPRAGGAPASSALGPGGGSPRPSARGGAASPAVQDAASLPRASSARGGSAVCEVAWLPGAGAAAAGRVELTSPAGARQPEKLGLGNLAGRSRQRPSPSNADAGCRASAASH